MTDAGWRVCVLLLGHVVACGADSSLAAPPGGSAASGGTGSASGGAGGSFDGGIPLPQTDCVVAVHADQCCSAPIPVSTASMLADPCLVPYGLEYLGAVIAACPAAERCSLLDCAIPPPLSRVAAPDPSSPGQCRFVHECTSDTDCTIASDLTRCCGCPEAVPRQLWLTNPCISPPGAPAGVVCNTCGLVMCEPCPNMPAPYCDGTGAAGFRLCTEALVF